MSNPTLVLIHGLCCHGNDWEQQSAAFAPSISVIAPTMLGHGDDATAPEALTISNLAKHLAQNLQNMGASKAILCGHSLGCRVALELAVQLPDVVQGIVLVDGSNTVQDDMAQTLNTFDQINDIHAWIQGIFSQMFLPGSFAAKQAIYSNRVAQMPAETLIALYRNMIIWDGTRFNQSLRNVTDKPLLVIQSTDRAEDGSRRWLKAGERSAYLDFVEALHTRCEILTYPDHGHFPHLDSPEKFVSDVLGWMADNALLTESDTIKSGTKHV